jgi:hypothetical protein
MKRPILAIAAIGALLSPAEAPACGGSGVSFIHERVPAPMPEGKVIAEVTFEGRGWIRLDYAGTPVRVRRMIQGPSAPVLILRLRIVSSCHRPIAGGTTGLIIGELAGSENGVPVVRPYAYLGDGRIGTPERPPSADDDGDPAPRP